MNAEKAQSQGFDIIIGNPPYIDYRKIDGKTKTSLSETSSVYKKSKEGSIYVYFLERFLLMLADKGNVSFINPIAYICQDSGKGIRTFIDNNLTLKQMLDVSNIKVFETLLLIPVSIFFLIKISAQSQNMGKQTIRTFHIYNGSLFKMRKLRIYQYF